MNIRKKLQLLVAMCLIVSICVSQTRQNAGAQIKNAPPVSIPDLIKESSERHGVDARLIACVIRQESGGKLRAISNKGASGVMQLMPGTASRMGVRNIFDAAENIDGGTKYLRFLLDLFDGDVRLALAGYNAGEGAVIKYGYRIPPYTETINYVEHICRMYYGKSGLASSLVYRRSVSNPSRQQGLQTSDSMGQRGSNIALITSRSSKSAKKENPSISKMITLTTDQERPRLQTKSVYFWK